MNDPRDRARQDLRDWQRVQPTNFFEADPQLQRLLRRLMRPALLAERVGHLALFGETVAGTLDAAAMTNNEGHHLPRLARYDAIGDRREAIVHHPSFDVCGEAIYGVGRVIAAYGTHQPNLYAQALFYLSSHVGEGGHNCPVACTAGVAKILQHVASPQLQERYLPGVLTPSWATCLTGAQFLTEVQGGSDVGANSVKARPDGEALGTTRWKIHGEKWFCSNADADLFLMTARPEGGPRGTRGLGLFLVPRRLEDGQLNEFTIRRLKDKLGTRSMASGEIDFQGATAYAMGPVDQGFNAVMTYVIGTSRLYNTVGCAGITRRACHIAEAYARTRHAFGQPIARFPLIIEMIANLHAQSHALTAGALTLAELTDRGEGGLLDPATGAFLRVATNLAKLKSCQHSHRAVLTAIETLGGNGAIESFSILPRLLRDNVVYENWEGTHNVLIAQTYRDFVKLELHVGFLHYLRDMMTGLPDDISQVVEPLLRVIDDAERLITELQQDDDPALGALRLKPHAEYLADTFFALALATDVATETEATRRTTDRARLALFVRTWLVNAGPERDAAYLRQITEAANL